MKNLKISLAVSIALFLTSSNNSSFFLGNISLSFSFRVTIGNANNKNNNMVFLILRNGVNISLNIPTQSIMENKQMVGKIGIDHVGISSDFDGGGGIVGWKDASETMNVTTALKERGYTDLEIEKLWGGNLLRVLDEVQEIAVKLQEGEL